MKKTYIIPAVSVYKLNVADGILLNLSGQKTDGENILGSGGNTSDDGFTGPEVRGESDWDIW